ncbi:MAG: lasso peptide biosynthesis PqqD family chaperone [Chloroflexota bacterium]
MITLSSTIGYHPNILASDLEDELVMLNLESSHYYGLEAVGKFIWEQLAQSKTVAQLVDELLAEFKVERETCEQEVLLFLQDLAQEGLIQVETPSA